jgi:hypothetical protein
MKPENGRQKDGLELGKAQSSAALILPGEGILPREECP